MQYIIIGIIGVVVLGFGIVLSYLDMGGKKKKKDASPEEPKEKK